MSFFTCENKSVPLEKQQKPPSGRDSDHELIP
jgi:hypothetical protein